MVDDAEQAIGVLLDLRGPGKTICPSEVARQLCPATWRARMPAVHLATAALLSRGEIATTWRGQAVVPGPGSGPYRIGRRVGTDLMP